MACTVCIYVICFGIMLSFVLGIILTAIGFLIILMQFIYQLPFAVWAGWTQADIVFPEGKRSQFVWQTVYATRLYKHWLFHKELEF